MQRRVGIITSKWKIKNRDYILYPIIYYSKMGLGTGRSLPFTNTLHLLPGKTHLQLLHSLAASCEHPASPHVHMQHCSPRTQNVSVGQENWFINRRHQKPGVCNMVNNIFTYIYILLLLLMCPLFFFSFTIFFFFFSFTKQVTNSV